MRWYPRPGQRIASSFDVFDFELAARAWMHWAGSMTAPGLRGSLTSPTYAADCGPRDVSGVSRREFTVGAWTSPSGGVARPDAVRPDDG